MEEILRTRGQKKLILLFDEYELFENKIDAGTLAEDALYILSSLMENQSVFLVFTGSQHLEQRRREYWRILGKSIFKQISYLDRDDAVSLIRKPVEARVHYAEGTVQAIYRLTAGQPFYTQAICQSLVDHLNEQRSNHATSEIVGTVVDGIINNPLPQMIFLWDGLDRDEKLVLALLAESLLNENAHAAANDVSRTQREYPVELSKVSISTALEKLFKSEMLLRDDATSPPGYAFRMDLWRLWVRRQHSVWQVMREEGLEIRPRPKWVARATIAGGIGLAAAVAAFVIPALRKDHGGATSSGPAATAVPTAPFALGVQPGEAVIYLDGRRIGMGSIQDAITAGEIHVFQIAAPGYADTEYRVKVPPGSSGSWNIRLHPLFGGLRVQTQPPGAEIRVDGRVRGKSPLSVNDLLVPKSHLVEASLAGYGSAERTVSVQAHRVDSLSFVLAVGKVDVVLGTEPQGAEIRVDGSQRGNSPLTLAGLALGRHTVSAHREAYMAMETTLVVVGGTRRIDLTLRREPPGILVILGDLPAQMYLDNALIIEGVQNSRPRELEGGLHQVRVVLNSGESIDTTVTVRPRQRATFDYSKRTITWKSQGGN